MGRLTCLYPREVWADGRQRRVTRTCRQATIKTLHNREGEEEQPGDSRPAYLSRHSISFRACESDQVRAVESQPNRDAPLGRRACRRTPACHDFYKQKAPGTPYSPTLMRLKAGRRNQRTMEEVAVVLPEGVRPSSCSPNP